MSGQAAWLPGFFPLTYGSPEGRGIYWAEWKSPRSSLKLTCRCTFPALHFPGVVAPRAWLGSTCYGGSCHTHPPTQSTPPHPDWLVTTERLTGSHPQTPFSSSDSRCFSKCLLSISRKTMTIQNLLSSLLPYGQLPQKKEELTSGQLSFHNCLFPPSYRAGK